MPTEVVMPKLGMTMTEGTLAEWLAPDGVEVRAGDQIFRLKTEKIDFVAEAQTDGVLRHMVTPGAVVPTGRVLAYLLAPGESLPASAAPMTAAAKAAAAPAQPGPTQAGGDGGWVRASPAARKLARELGVDLRLIRAAGDGVAYEANVRAFAESGAAAVTAAAPRVDGKVSPLARKLAAQHGVDLAGPPLFGRGSGPGGRIVQEDVERLIAAPGATTSPVQPPVTAPAPAAAAGTTIPFTGMRRTIAERMHASLQQMAQLTITSEADVTELARLRSQLVEEWGPDGVRPTYTDLVLRAVARALGEHPRVNASLEGEVIQLHARVNVGVAVALDEGLIVPVVHDADRLPLKALARATAELADRARRGALTYDEVTGGTFSVTSLGMYDVDTFTPIVNPPQAAILGIGRVRDALALEGREVVARKTLPLSLSFDHRVLDGAPAAEFLRRVRTMLERPYLLLVADA